MDRLNELINQYKLPIILTFIGLVLIIGGLFFSGSSISKPKQQFPKESLVKDIKDIKVDISGAVQNPGVYALSSDQRVEDVIRIAGGFSAQVNTEFVAKKLNLSQKISDGMKLYIPFKGENTAVLGVTSTALGVTRVSINVASSSELEALPGIGQVTAAKIINGRPYQDINELVSKKVVSKSVFTKIKDLIELN